MDLKNWKLTLDVEDPKTKKVMEVTDLKCFDHPHFMRLEDHIKFKAKCGGRTTSGSKYPRSELRELINGKLASWDTMKGKHVMKWECAVTHLPKVKSQVVVGQIHDDKDDVIEIRHSGDFVEVFHDDIKYGKLITNYKLGDKYSASIEVSNGKIAIHSGSTSIIVPTKSKNCYFKLGCYVQSNVSKGDSPEEYGEVKLYSVEVKHE